jgi:hypothetical protein
MKPINSNFLSLASLAHKSSNQQQRRNHYYDVGLQHKQLSPLHRIVIGSYGGGGSSGCGGGTAQILPLPLSFIYLIISFKLEVTMQRS